MNGAPNEDQEMNSCYHLLGDPCYTEEEQEDDPEEDPKEKEELNKEMESSKHKDVDPIHEEKHVTTPLFPPYQPHSGIPRTQKVA